MHAYQALKKFEFEQTDDLKNNVSNSFLSI